MVELLETKSDIYVFDGNQLALKLTDKDSHVPVPTRLADLETHIERGKHI